MGVGLRPIPLRGPTAIGDFQRYPGCRLMLACTMCGWSKDYNPERVIDRLRELRSGGHATRLEDVAKRVGWNCPCCSRTKWRMQFAWPESLTAREAKRLQNLYRN